MFIFLLIFLLLAFLAAIVSFHFAKNRLKTPFITNLVGSFCIWSSVFCLGADFSPSAGPWARSSGEIPPYMTALAFFALAVLAFGLAYLFQRAFNKKL